MRRRRQTTTPVPPSTYTEWWWPPSPTIYRTIPAGYRSFEHAVRPEVDPGSDAAYLLAHEFKLVAGQAGHLGLSTRDEDARAAGGKLAVFSIQARTCRIPYPWGEGRVYQMRVWTDEPGWWSAGVREDRGDEERLIGRIQVPEEWRRLASWSVMWTKYRGGPLSRCEDLPPCRVAFSAPTADEGSVQPERHESRVDPGTCEGARVEAAPGGVRHTMGT